MDTSDMFADKSTVEETIKHVIALSTMLSDDIDYSVSELQSFIVYGLNIHALISSRKDRGVYEGRKSLSYDTNCVGIMIEYMADYGEKLGIRLPSLATRFYDTTQVSDEKEILDCIVDCIESLPPSVRDVKIYKRYMLYLALLYDNNELMDMFETVYDDQASLVTRICSRGPEDFDPEGIRKQMSKEELEMHRFIYVFRGLAHRITIRSEYPEILATILLSEYSDQGIDVYSTDFCMKYIINNIKLFCGDDVGETMEVKYEKRIKNNGNNEFASRRYPVQGRTSRLHRM